MSKSDQSGTATQIVTVLSFNDALSNDPPGARHSLTTEINCEEIQRLRLRPRTLKIESKDDLITAMRNGQMAGRVCVVLGSHLRDIPDRLLAETFSIEAILFETKCESERIGEAAFMCTRIRKIMIPMSVRIIARAAFKDCNRLEYVGFEEGSLLESIDDEAFVRTAIEAIEFPAGLTEVAATAFDGCVINTFSVHDRNSRLNSMGTLLLNHDNSEILLYGGASYVEIPSNVKVISEGLFEGKRNLCSVIFPTGSQLESIRERSFAESGLRQITIPVYVKIGRAHV